MEAAQERLGEGPCVEAFEKSTLQLIPDTAAEERWPASQPCRPARSVGYR
jgi:hypothetical protein